MVLLDFLAGMTRHVECASEFPTNSQQLLTDDLLKHEFLPLVNLVLQSPKVGSAAIFPVSTYGFGNAEPHRCHAVEVEIEVDAACEEDVHWLLWKVGDPPTEHGT